MKATVVTPFRDVETGVVHKEVGKPYPTENVSKERLELLSKPHPKTGKVYIFIEQQAKEVPSTEQVEQQGDEAPATEEKPKRGRRAPAKKVGE